MDVITNFYGSFDIVSIPFLVPGIICLYLGFAYFSIPILFYFIPAVILGFLLGLSQLSWAILIGLILLSASPLRRYLLSGPIFTAIKAFNILPNISATEKEAIEAGDVWVEGMFFEGTPRFKDIFSQLYPELTPEEQAFLDGPVNTLCEMASDWDIHTKRDLSPETWQFIKENKFFGMIIPKQYGGLEFSAIAHSAVIAKLSARSSVLGITTMVPNSLGPAELLIHYGTQSQKDYYLPRLADGEEIPCFALTESQAGSDAGAMNSHGVLFRDDNGEIKIRLNWQKRYITLAAISTILGLAFKLEDPQNVMGQGEDLGITCALIPSDTPGVVLGERHDPLGVPFYNCPTEGHDVEIPISAVIGGQDQVGTGWKMLMECLSAGRGISLPSNCTGGAKMVSRATGAYTQIRRQFGLSIGKFEGIHTPLSQIAGFSYMLDALRTFTAGAVDQGLKPAVSSAIAKYHATESFRTIINHGMDILAGAAISKGPRNVLANAYVATPIGITVEGANILTRTLMIFGQGAIRCHPYVLKEVHAIEENDLAAFDVAFWGHISHVLKNFVRMILLYISRGHLSFPGYGGKLRRPLQKLTWASTVFAFLTDLILGTLGGGLKLKGNITGRFGDVLSWLYLCTCSIRRYIAEGEQKEDWIYVEWIMAYGLNQIQVAFEGLLSNMGFIYKPALVLLKLSPFSSPPSDKLNSKLANSLQTIGEQRERLTKDTFISSNQDDGLARLENAFQAIVKTAPIAKKLSLAIKSKQLPKKPLNALIDIAYEKEIIDIMERDLLKDAEDKRLDAIQVDAFSKEAYFSSAG